MPDIKVRREMPDVALTREQFAKRMRQQFYDPAFDPLSSEIDRIITDRCVIDVTPLGLVLRELAPGTSLDELRAITGPPLIVNDNVATMAT